MSLKAFHVFFITASILLAIGFGLWALREYSEAGRVGYLAAAVLSFAASGALAVYGTKFLDKCRRMGLT